MTLNPKQNQLHDAVLLFELSDRTPADYQALFVAFHQVIKPGSGLVWDQVEEAVSAALESRAGAE